jgi:hypothetical protein
LRRSGVICDHADHERARTSLAQVQVERLAPVMSDLRSRRSPMEGASIPGRIDATEDTARRRFAAVATLAPADLQPSAAARLAER